MRPELREKLMADWLGAGVGYTDHVSSILSLRLTPAERAEIAAMFDQTEDDSLLYIWAGVMYTEPDPAYRAILIKSLDSPNKDKVADAVLALLSGHYEGALDLVFKNERALKALEDNFPQLLLEYEGKMSREMELKVLDLFCERFAHDSRVDFYSAPWFNLLTLLQTTTDKAAEVLARLWKEVDDEQRKYNVLMAMAGNPHPLYEPIFLKLVKGRDREFREFAKEGLHGLETENEGKE